MQNHTPSKSNYAVQDVGILIAEKLIYCGYVVTTAIKCRYYNYMYFLLLFFICLFILFRGRRGRDRMVVGFTITCAIGAYHH